MISVCEAESYSYLVKRLTAGGRLENFIEHGIAYPRFQDLPPEYRPNGAFYVNRTESLIREQTFSPGDAGVHNAAGAFARYRYRVGFLSCRAFTKASIHDLIYDARFATVSDYEGLR